MTVPANDFASFPLLSPTRATAAARSNSTQLRAALPTRIEGRRAFNLGGVKCRYLIPSPLVHDANQSAGGFFQSFNRFLSSAAHIEQLSERFLSWVTSFMSRVAKCL